jgi:hypothetical protein
MSNSLPDNETGVPISKPRRLFQNTDRTYADQWMTLSAFDLDFKLQSNAGGANEAG